LCIHIFCPWNCYKEHQEFIASGSEEHLPKAIPLLSVKPPDATRLLNPIYIDLDLKTS
jgi:hypothetical protein